MKSITTYIQQKPYEMFDGKGFYNLDSAFRSITKHIIPAENIQLNFPAENIQFNSRSLKHTLTFLSAFNRFCTLFDIRHIIPQVVKRTQKQLSI